MQVPILSGIYVAPKSVDFLSSYPRNLVPVPKDHGIAKGYLRPADGIDTQGSGGPGIDRGGCNWDGSLYRVMGTNLCKVGPDGLVTVLGDVGGAGRVTIDSGFDRLAVASGKKLFYWDGTTLTQVTDVDLGDVLDVTWISGYYLTTDGTYIVSTDLNDPTSVTTLHYGAADSDPDPIRAVDALRNEAYAFNRYTIEVFQNVGGTGFPFSAIPGAQVGRGIIGTHTVVSIGGTFVFMGSGRREPPGIYLMTPGDTRKLSTREIDAILQGYTEEQLAASFMEARIEKDHTHVMVHLPDQCLVYDVSGSVAYGEHVWFSLTSSVNGIGQYRASGLVWCYDRWNVGDPQSGAIGYLTGEHSLHWGEKTGWEFGASVLYGAGNDGIVHELELVCLTGKVAQDVDPVIWTSYSKDGETWSQERTARAGTRGERAKRIVWRTQGTMGHWRVQRFRGTSDAHVSISRLEAQIEPLFVKAKYYG